MMAVLYTHPPFLSLTHTHTHIHTYTHPFKQREATLASEHQFTFYISISFVFLSLGPSLSSLQHFCKFLLSLSLLLSFQVFLVTAVSLVIGTCPIQTAAPHVTVTPWVPSARSVSLRGVSVSVSLGWGDSAVTLVVGVHMV